LVVAAIAIIVVAPQAPSWGRQDPSGAFSHEVLESDRVMTLQMGGDVPGMTLQMPGGGMLSRSASDEYLRALEEHTRLYDKMAGLGG
jgi:hypothetical protein